LDFLVLRGLRDLRDRRVRWEAWGLKDRKVNEDRRVFRVFVDWRGLRAPSLVLRVRRVAWDLRDLVVCPARRPQQEQPVPRVLPVLGAFREPQEHQEPQEPREHREAWVLRDLWGLFLVSPHSMG